MIPVSRDEILSCFAGILAVLKTLHKLHPAITCKTFHPRTGSLFCTARILLYRDKVFPCNRFSQPRWDEKVNQKISTEVPFNRLKIFLLCFYNLYDVNLWKKKVNKYLCRVSLFYRSSHWRSSAKMVFLKFLQYSQGKTCVGVSLWAFKSVILSKRDSNIDIFLWILRKF